MGCTMWERAQSGKHACGRGRNAPIHSTRPIQGARKLIRRTLQNNDLLHGTVVAPHGPFAHVHPMLLSCRNSSSRSVSNFPAEEIKKFKATTIKSQRSHVESVGEAQRQVAVARVQLVDEFPLHIPRHGGHCEAFGHVANTYSYTISAMFYITIH